MSAAFNQFGAVRGMIPCAGAQNSNAAPFPDGVANMETTVQSINTDAGSKVASPYTNEQFAALRSEPVMTTPAMAAMLRETCHFERQRPITQSNVDRLALEMSRGWFIPGTPIYLCVLPDGSMQIANGNHTLEAIKASGATVPLTFIYNRVNSIEDVARIYANHDLQKVRTWRHALQAMNGEATFFEGKMLTAVGVVMTGFSSEGTVGGSAGTTSRSARFNLLEEYRSAGEVIEQATKGAPRANSKMVERAGVLAVALLTARYQPALALEFWGALAHDDGLEVGKPCKTLLRYLVNTPATGQSTRPIHAKAAALAWNANFQGRALASCRPNAMTQIRILGTNWHNGAPDREAAPARCQPIPPQPTAPMFETGIMQNGNGTTQGVARFIG